MRSKHAIAADSAAAPGAGLAVAPVPFEATLAAVLDALPVGVLIFQQGPHGVPVCLAANATFESWARYPHNQLIGLPLPRIRFLNENPRVAVSVEALLGDPHGADREIDWTVAEAPRQRHLSAHVSPLPPTDGAPTRVVVAVRDRTPEIQAERNLRQTMLTDALTGLPNRVLFTEQVEEAIEAAPDANIAVAIVNIDRFKRVNDNLGHVVGDELLISVARRLLPCVRANDCVARLSGDEFAILMKNIDSTDDTLRVVERIQNTMNAPFTISGGEFFVSASVGVATTLSSGRYAEDLIRDADFALHSAKARSRGGISIYQSSAHGAARDLFRLETDLRKALEHGELDLYYQPLVRLADNRLAGFEALARWTHPDRGPVPPSDFIAVAEDTGLIVPLGRWAMETACRQLAQWRAEHGAAASELGIGVNVSGLQFARDDVVASVRSVLDATGLPGQALKVELTESAIVENPELAKQIFARLKALDCSIAMDDFGTGYSSLSYLQTLPIDILKIDRSFVMGMLESEDSHKIVTAIMSLSNSLGMQTIAEGVERIEQVDRLRALGCDIAQGYLYARPMTAIDAARLIVAGYITPN